MNKRRYNINLFLSGFIGYFMGSIMYGLLVESNSKLGSIFGFVVGGVFGYLYHIYASKAYKEVLDEVDIEEKDERGRYIKYQASFYTLSLLRISILGLILYLILKDQLIIGYIIGGIYVVSAIFEIIFKAYLSKSYTRK